MDSGYCPMSEGLARTPPEAPSSSPSVSQIILRCAGGRCPQWDLNPLT